MIEELITELIRRLTSHEKRVERLESLENASGGSSSTLAHDHSGDAGDGGTFDAANLTSGAATDGQVLTADGSGGAAWEASTLTDGTDIHVSGNTIAREGRDILRFSSVGALCAEYPANETGLAAALAGAASGDIVEIPAGMIAASVTVPAGVTLRGWGWNSILNGTLTLAAGAGAEHLQVYQSVNSGDDIIGVIGPATGTAVIRDVQVSLAQAGAGKSLGLLSNGGTLRAYECEVWATTAYGNAWGFGAVTDAIVEFNQGQVKAWIEEPS